MKCFTLVLLTVCLLPLSIFASPIDTIGGDFAGTPEMMDASISKEAKKLVQQSFADLTPEQLEDMHVHVVGLDHQQGTSVNERMFSWMHPVDYIKTSVYLSGADVHNTAPLEANQQYMARLVQLIQAIPHHGKYHLLAFDRYYNPNGSINKEKTEFYTSNDYMMQQMALHPDMFVPVISVHPFRTDALVELEKWAKQGVKWVKWLPNAQGINASDPRIDAYYQIMKKYHMTLLTHVGEEQAVKADADQALGNPLLFRRPLDIGVRVVMAHCASSGENADLDYPGKKATNFDLFMRLMQEPRYEGLLYGEISAITQFNRLPTPLLTLLSHPELHHRLVNGSDYPLPALNIIIQTKSLKNHGFITQKERLNLNEIYRYNPLLFDYVLKRTVRHPQTGKAFDPVVFLDIDNPLRSR